MFSDGIRRSSLDTSEPSHLVDDLVFGRMYDGNDRNVLACVSINNKMMPICPVQG
jgi:hypothetical protein